MRINTWKSTANTGLSELKNQLKNLLNVGIIQKVSHGSNAPIITANMSISVPLPLRRRLPVRAGTSAQVITRNDSCFFQNTSGENVLLKLPHRQFVCTIPKLHRVYFKYDRNLGCLLRRQLEDVSRIIFLIVTVFHILFYLYLNNYILIQEIIYYINKTRIKRVFAKVIGEIDYEEKEI